MFSMFAVNNIDQLRNVFQDGMNCLNAGCGVAWSEYLFNINSKVNRFAIDISLSVEAAYAKTKNMDNVCIIQADLNQLPFEKNYFDIIFSAGVLHHTGNTRGSFRNLCEFLKPSGIIGVYIYCTKPFIRELVDEEIRKITTKLDYNQCHEFSKQMTMLGASFYQLKKKIIIKEDIPLLNIKKGEYNLQRFIFDHFVKCFYNEKLGPDVCDMINLDWYHPQYASHHTKDEIESFFVENNIKDIKFVQPKGWEHSGYFVSGRKA